MLLYFAIYDFFLKMPCDVPIMRLTQGFHLDHSILGRTCGGAACGGEADAGNLARLLAAHHFVVRLCAWSSRQHVRSSSHTSLLKTVSDSKFLSSLFASSLSSFIFSRNLVVTVHSCYETVYCNS